MTGVLRVSVVVFLVAVLQSAVISEVTIFRGTPDVVLVLTVLVAFLRGSVPAACAGFAGGLLVEIGTLEPTLGVHALVFALVGYWAGRYAETTGRDRPYAPYAAVLVLGMLAGAGVYLMHFLLGDAGDAGIALGPVLPTAVLGLAVALVLMRFVRMAVGVSAGPRRARDLEAAAA